MRNLIVLLRRRLQLAGGFAPVSPEYLLLENGSFVLLENSSKIVLE